MQCTAVVEGACADQFSIQFQPVSRAIPAFSVYRPATGIELAPKTIESKRSTGQHSKLFKERA
jgi:hypothetical protein